MEPPAILIPAFEVHVRGPRQPVGLRMGPRGQRPAPLVALGGDALERGQALGRIGAATHHQTRGHRRHCRGGGDHGHVGLHWTEVADVAVSQDAAHHVSGVLILGLA